MPLYLEDFLDVQEINYSYKKDEKESFFLQQVSVIQEKLHYEKEAPELSYTIIDVKIPALYEVCVDYFLREASRYDETSEYRTIEDTRWDAKEVYKIFDGTSYVNTYLVCYENRLIRISLYDFIFTNDDEAVKIISEKLKPN